MDNRSHEESGWDYDLLSEELFELKDLELDLKLTGFGDDELSELMVQKTAGLTDDDEVPEAPAEPVTRAGDVWILGKHRLLCGDATKGVDIERLMGEKKEAAIVTDPPYGVGQNYNCFEDSVQSVRELITAIMPRILASPCAVLTPGVPCMWSYPQPTWLMAWIHPAPTGACPWGFAGVNPILAYGKDPYLTLRLGGRPDSLVAACDREGVTGHPTPKPAKVWRWLVERVTPHAGQIVLDLFAGSGTTFIVAEETGRYCCGIEIDPIYCDVAITRWQNFTGREATLDGCTFAQVKETRMAVSA